jgi:hypothetical protein
MPVLAPTFTAACKAQSTQWWAMSGTEAHSLTGQDTPVPGVPCSIWMLTQDLPMHGCQMLGADHIMTTSQRFACTPRAAACTAVVHEKQVSSSGKARASAPTAAMSPHVH